MANDVNWEAQLDWSKIDPVGGIGFYSFIKGSAIKSMEAGLKPLMVEAGRIKAMAARTQKTLRIAKKVVERVGERFWMEADPLPKMV